MEPLPRTAFPGQLDSLGLIRGYVKDAAASCSLGTAPAYQLMLAVDEIATNIILHGYQEHGLSGELVVSCAAGDGLLRITLEDTAAPFDPRAVPLPGAEDLARPLDDRPMGGLGIYLTVNGVDRFDYRREGDRNINLFEVALPG
jgi:anti-sigma regulatory factor (Ser/Thr protein kinase)